VLLYCNYFLLAIDPGGKSPDNGRILTLRTIPGPILRLAQSARVPVSFLRYILTFLGGMRPNYRSRTTVAPECVFFLGIDYSPVTRTPRAPLTACCNRRSTRELCLNLGFWLAKHRATGLGGVEWWLSNLSSTCVSSWASRQLSAAQPAP